MVKYNSINMQIGRTQKFIYIPVLILILFFVTSRFYDIGTKINIKTSSIENGQTVVTSILQITGQARKAKNLYINDKNISVTKDGQFESTISLPSGYNILTIKAVDKFGKTSTKEMVLNVLDDDISGITKIDITKNIE